MDLRRIPSIDIIDLADGPRSPVEVDEQQYDGVAF